MTNFKNTINLLAALALASLLCLVPAPASAQTILSSTTLGAAITLTGGSSAATNITVASTSGMTSAGLASQINTVLFVDHEFMWVTTVVDSTHLVVQRGKGPTRPQAHANGATVWFGAPLGNFVGTNQAVGEVSGSCTATNLQSLPLIYVQSAHFYDCIGSQWVQTAGPGMAPVLGSTVASPAGVMTPTGTIFVVSGTNAITGVTLPNGAGPGFQLQLIPSGTFTTTTATNIGLASTAVVAKTLTLTWTGSKWDPSY